MTLSDKQFWDIIEWGGFLIGLLFIYIASTMIGSEKPEKKKAATGLMITGFILWIPGSVRTFYRLYLK
jgi:hypothetical protein